MAALIPTITYLLLSIFSDIFVSKTKIVEEKYSSLNEKLRTAEDNIKYHNPVIDELQEDVVSNAKNVSASSFLSTRELLVC